MLPSLYEPFGNAVLEAQLYEMPAITTDNWAFPDFVNSDTGLRVADPTNERELAEKMDYFLSRPDLSAQKGAWARENVLKNYTWQEVAERMRKEVSAH